MADLFVIEAPGKARQLQEILKGIGVEGARVQATKGHLYSMPDRLTPLGIDSGFREFARKLRDPEIGLRIRQEAQAADRVYIATDADQEGDVIAWDVAELISDIHPEPWRVRLRGMDEDSVLEAINNPDPVRKRDAVAGRTRAIVDRMIGAVFSRDGVAVGRVGTALLGLVASNPPAIDRLRLVAPASDGGRPWVAECDVRAPITRQMATRLAAVRFPALDSARRTPAASIPPANMGDIMVRAGDDLDMSPKEAERSLQRLYEAGRMSYPRAGSRGISKSVLRKVGKVLAKSGYKFDEAVVAGKAASDVHDAPYPIGPVEVQRDPRKQGQEEGLRTLVSRGLVRSGQAHETELGVGAKAGRHLASNGFPAEVCDAVAALEWRREHGPRYPGQETWPESKVIARRSDTVLLEAAVKAGLGRPSTWASHIEAFMGRGLVDEDLNLTDKGREWISASPPALLDPRISAAIESACEKAVPGMMDDPSREPWEILAQRIVEALPAEIRKPLHAAVASEPPHPKEDPVAFYRPTEGLDDMLAKARERTYAYGPRGPDLPQ